METTYPPPDDNDDDYCPDNGDPWVHEERYSFRDLVRLIENGRYREPSSFPIDRPGRGDWLRAETETDMHTGELTEHSLHLSACATPREARYWAKAWDAAGVRYNRGVKA